MAFYGDPEKHAANPPETWTVVKVGARRWHVRDAQGDTLEGYDTKREADAARVDGWLAQAYRREGRWFAGETPAGHKSWAECKAEREQREARDAARARATYAVEATVARDRAHEVANAYRDVIGSHVLNVARIEQHEPADDGTRLANVLLLIDAPTEDVAREVQSALTVWASSFSPYGWSGTILRPLA